MLTYTIDIAGMKRDLPLCQVSEDLYIGAFVLFGDVELTIHCASELLKRAPAYDYLIAPRPRPYLSCMRWPGRAAPKDTSWPARAPRLT
jgi:hypothetical protein